MRRERISLLNSGTFRLDSVWPHSHPGFDLLSNFQDHEGPEGRHC